MRVTLVGSGGHRASNLPDSAGPFDAAGDFDRLLGTAGNWLVWGSIDEHAITTVDSTHARLLLSDLAQLSARAHDGPEAHGLRRLASMAVICADDPGTTLFFHGD